MIAKVCDRESRRDTWFENRLVTHHSIHRPVGFTFSSGFLHTIAYTGPQGLHSFQVFYTPQHTPARRVYILFRFFTHHSIHRPVGFTFSSGFLHTIAYTSPQGLHSLQVFYTPQHTPARRVYILFRFFTHHSIHRPVGFTFSSGFLHTIAYTGPQGLHSLQVFYTPQHTPARRVYILFRFFTHHSIYRPVGFTFSSGFLHTIAYTGPQGLHSLQVFYTPQHTPARRVYILFRFFTHHSIYRPVGFTFSSGFLHTIAYTGPQGLHSLQGFYTPQHTPARRVYILFRFFTHHSIHRPVGFTFSSGIFTHHSIHRPVGFTFSSGFLHTIAYTGPQGLHSLQVFYTPQHIPARRVYILFRFFTHHSIHRPVGFTFFSGFLHTIAYTGPQGLHSLQVFYTPQHTPARRVYILFRFFTHHSIHRPVGFTFSSGFLHTIAYTGPQGLHSLQVFYTPQHTPARRVYILFRFFTHHSIYQPVGFTFSSGFLHTIAYTGPQGLHSLQVFYTPQHTPARRVYILFRFFTHHSIHRPVGFTFFSGFLHTIAYTGPQGLHSLQVFYTPQHTPARRVYILFRFFTHHSIYRPVGFTFSSGFLHTIAYTGPQGLHSFQVFYTPQHTPARRVYILFRFFTHHSIHRPVGFTFFSGFLHTIAYTGPQGLHSLQVFTHHSIYRPVGFTFSSGFLHTIAYTGPQGLHSFQVFYTPQHIPARRVYILFRFFTHHSIHRPVGFTFFSGFLHTIAYTGPQGLHSLQVFYTPQHTPARRVYILFRFFTHHSIYQPVGFTFSSGFLHTIAYTGPQGLHSLQVFTHHSIHRPVGFTFFSGFLHTIAYTGPQGLHSFQVFYTPQHTPARRVYILFRFFTHHSIHRPVGFTFFSGFLHTIAYTGLQGLHSLQVFYTPQHTPARRVYILFRFFTHHSIHRPVGFTFSSGFLHTIAYTGPQGLHSFQVFYTPQHTPALRVYILFRFLHTIAYTGPQGLHSLQVFYTPQHTPARRVYILFRFFTHHSIYQPVGFTFSSGFLHTIAYTGPQGLHSFQVFYTPQHTPARRVYILFRFFTHHSIHRPVGFTFFSGFLHTIAYTSPQGLHSLQVFYTPQHTPAHRVYILFRFFTHHSIYRPVGFTFSSGFLHTIAYTSPQGLHSLQVIYTPQHTPARRVYILFRFFTHHSIHRPVGFTFSSGFLHTIAYTSPQGLHSLQVFYTPQHTPAPRVYILFRYFTHHSIYQPVGFTFSSGFLHNIAYTGPQGLHSFQVFYTPQHIPARRVYILFRFFTHHSIHRPVGFTFSSGFLHTIAYTGPQGLHSLQVFYTPQHTPARRVYILFRFFTHHSIHRPVGFTFSSGFLHTIAYTGPQGLHSLQVFLHTIAYTGPQGLHSLQVFYTPQHTPARRVYILFRFFTHHSIHRPVGFTFSSGFLHTIAYTGPQGLHSLQVFYTPQHTPARRVYILFRFFTHHSIHRPVGFTFSSGFLHTIAYTGPQGLHSLQVFYTPQHTPARRVYILFRFFTHHSIYQPVGFTFFSGFLHTIAYTGPQGLHSFQVFYTPQHTPARRVYILFRFFTHHSIYQPVGFKGLRDFFNYTVIYPQS